MQILQRAHRLLDINGFLIIKEELIENGTETMITLLIGRMMGGT